MSIWLVEDNALHARMIAQAFTGEALRIFDNGAALLEQLAGEAAQCDVLVLDWNLPDMSGLDVCRFLRRSYDEITLPILILTVQGNKTDIVEGLVAGANDYLTKPFDSTELRARVGTLRRIKRLNEERLRAETERDRYRDLMLGVIGHDLRTPLHAISVAAETMTLLETSTDVHHRMLTRMKSSTDRMSRMIEQVLDFTRSRFGGLDIKRRAIALDAIVMQCAHEFELIDHEHPLLLSVEDACEVQWDADRIMQVVSNLLSNASQHGAKGTPISLTARRHGENAEISVHNAGPAIPPEAQAEIFDPFKRGQDRARTKGLGLGLYIARQIAEAHGGSIDLASSAAGTTFTIRLPRFAA